MVVGGRHDEPYASKNNVIAGLVVSRRQMYVEKMLETK